MDDTPPERGNRRGSLGRAFSKLKDSFKRRSSVAEPKSATKRTSVLDSTPEAGTSAAPETPASVNLLPSGPSTIGDGAAADQPILQPVARDIDTSSMITIDDSDEPLLPITTTRKAMIDDRARFTFDKYNVKYASRQANVQSEPPNKIRRVEKPVRIRLHWTCHECGAHFGVNKACANCNHQRCGECSRSPARRVKEIIDIARQTQEQEEQREGVLDEYQPAPSVPRQEVATSTGVAEASTISALATIPVIASASELEKDDNPPEEVADTAHYRYVVEHRPRAGMEVVLRPKAQIIRRTCHECEAQFNPPNRTECQSCGHLRCKLCPRHPGKREKLAQSMASDENAFPEQRMVATVQRVYKKPRQRVRWTCGECQSLFLDRERCRSCGHERCSTCSRLP